MKTKKIVIHKESEDIEKEIPAVIEKIVKKYATYSAHCTVPFSWLGKRVRLELLDD